MRLALIPLLLLPMTMRAQVPHGSTPLRDAAPDSLVCFTMAEAALIHDTVWSAVNHRRARVIMAAMIGNLERQLADQKLVSAAHEQRANKAESVVAKAVTGEQDAQKDRDFWQVRAGRNTKKGIGIGVGISVAAFFGGRELYRQLR